MTTKAVLMERIYAVLERPTLTHAQQLAIALEILVEELAEKEAVCFICEQPIAGDKKAVLTADGEAHLRCFKNAKKYASEARAAYHRITE